MKIEYDWLNVKTSNLSLLDKIKMLFLKKHFSRDCVNGYRIEHTYKIYKNKIYIIKEQVFRDKVVE